MYEVYFLMFFRSAIQTSLERRGLNINGINIFVEASNTPLPLECESFLLGGNTLNIKGKISTLPLFLNSPLLRQILRPSGRGWPLGIYQSMCYTIF